MPKSVLVVEDDFDTLHPLAELLRLRGYEVNTASNAEQALTVARQQTPDLIITDIVLPGKSGLHFIQSIRNDDLLGQTPVIVISGCGPMILVEAESAGADICLEKPIRIDEFWRALELILGRVSAVAAKPFVQPDLTIKQASAEIDGLVDELRQCSTKPDRDNVLKKLKDVILNRTTKSGAA